MPLVITALGSGHTDAHAHTYQHANQSNFKKSGACSLRFNGLDNDNNGREIDPYTYKQC